MDRSSDTPAGATPRRASAEAIEQILAAVESRVGPIEPASRGAWAGRIAKLTEAGLSETATESMVGDQIAEAIDEFRRSMALFHILVRSIDLTASTLEGKTEPLTLTDYVVDARVELTRLHRALANQAWRAGVPNMGDTDELDEAIVEAENERASWRAAREAAGK
jgi:hypothetical protein